MNLVKLRHNAPTPSAKTPLTERSCGSGERLCTGLTVPYSFTLAACYPLVSKRTATPVIT